VRLRQLCCHPQVSNEDRKILGEATQSLDQVRDKMIAHKQVGAPFLIIIRLAIIFVVKL
jgi:hypothetical protein